MDSASDSLRSICSEAGESARYSSPSTPLLSCWSSGDAAAALWRLSSSSCSSFLHMNKQKFVAGNMLLPENIEWFIEGQAFSRRYDLAPRPPPPPPPVSNLDRRLRQPADGWGGGMGWVRSQIIRSQESLGHYKSFNTLCLGPSKYLFIYQSLKPCKCRKRKNGDLVT